MWAEFGYIGVSAVLWGSTFVPTKEFPVGDGLYYQWIMSVGIWLAGHVFNLFLDSPPLQPIAMLGGFLWTTGNLMTVPIVRLSGLGLGMLLWGTSRLVTGWASSRFGLFGLHEQSVSVPWLNYLGVATAVLGGVCYVLIKPNTDKTDRKYQLAGEMPDVEEVLPLLPGKGHGPPPQRSHGSHVERLPTRHRREESEVTNFGLMLREDSDDDGEETSNQRSDIKRKPTLGRSFLDFVNMEDHEDLRHVMMHYFDLDSLSLGPADARQKHCMPITLFHLDTMPPLQKRILGVVMALVAGVLYGVAFNPTQWLIDNRPDLPRQAIYYLYSHISGVFMTSTVYFFIYGVLTRNNPQVYPQVTLPALVSGVMWSFAQLCFFLATPGLGMVITMPITTVGPGVIASLWSVFVFHEIQGRHNYITLVVAISVSLCAMAMLVLSF